MVGGCSKEPAPAQAAAKQPVKAKTTNTAAGSVDLGGPAYQPGALTAIGKLSGTIKLDGAAPADSVAITPPAVDERVCGTKAPGSVSATPNGLAGAIVWIAGATTGKPLPIEKRAALASEKCALDPRVQAVVAGTTVNVFNDDKAIHRLVFLAAGSGDTLTVMPFFNEGQVVASERLAKGPGIVEVRCVQHPWTRGYVAVFEHPYFTVTEADGSFTIDSLPAGKYTVNVWHEGMVKPIVQQVQIDANGSAKLDLALKLP